MADDTSTTDPTADTTPAGDGQQSADPSDEALGDPGKKALAEERRQRKAAEKAHNDAMARLKEFEDRDKTDLQKLEERATAAERRADEAARTLLQIRIARETDGLETDDADLITGSTEDEMKASAKRLATRLGGGGTQFDGGSRTPAARPTDMNDLIRRSRSTR